MNRALRGQGRLPRFLAVGIGANLLFFVLCYAFARLGTPAFAAAASAYAVAFAAAYAAQRNWTFGVAESHARLLPRYLAAQLASAVLSGLVGQACAGLLGASPFWMSVAVTATAAAASYLLSSRWVFATRASAAAR